MGRWCRIAAIGVLALGTAVAVGSPRAMAQTRAHVYLFRGLADVFSTGMDVLCDELNKRGVYATSHSHTEWKSLVDQAAANYKAKKEAPIILIGHSLGADAVMEMADRLGDRGVPVALVVPFDGTQSFPASANIAHVLNLTQRDYAYMRPGPGFRGTLNNVDLSSDTSIDHITIDKSPRLHAMVIGEVLALVGGRRMIPPDAAKPAAAGTYPPGGEGGGPAAPAKSGNGEIKLPNEMRGAPDNGTPVIAQPEGYRPSTSSAGPAAAPAPAAPPVTPPLQKPAAPVQPAKPELQIPD